MTQRQTRRQPVPPLLQPLETVTPQHAADSPTIEVSPRQPRVVIDRGPMGVIRECEKEGLISASAEAAEQNNKKKVTRNGE